MPNPLGDSRISGQDGVATIDTGGTPIILDVFEWDYGEKERWAVGSTAGNYGTGRRLTGIDWDARVVARIKDGGASVPQFFRRGAQTGFDFRSDLGATPALKVVGIGAISEPRFRGRVGEEYAEYEFKLICFSSNLADAPVVTVHA